MELSQHTEVTELPGVPNSLLALLSQHSDLPIVCSHTMHVQIFPSPVRFRWKRDTLTLFGLTPETNLRGRGVPARAHECSHGGNGLLDFLMLSRSSLFQTCLCWNRLYIFFSPGGIILTTFVFPLENRKLSFLIAWLEERRKPVLHLHEDLLCLVPKCRSYSPKGRRAAMSCNAVREWNKGRNPTSY